MWVQNKRLNGSQQSTFMLMRIINNNVIIYIYIYITDSVRKQVEMKFKSQFFVFSLSDLSGAFCMFVQSFMPKTLSSFDMSDTTYSYFPYFNSYTILVFFIDYNAV